MIDLTLIGIGTGNPQHLTLQAINALNTVDLILIPNKGAGKDDLAGLRREICDQVIQNRDVKITEFDLPTRDPKTADYRQRVDDWHDAIARVWSDEIHRHLPDGGKVGFLVWGDPSLYDSTMRIADRLQRQQQVEMTVIPGITSIQALTASHAIPVNEIGAPFTITTGRQLRDKGWPDSADTLVIMLDGECSFQSIDATGVKIWWSAYAGMKEEILISGPLAEVSDQIIETRARARTDHGWIMDIYLLRR
ncbi:precorrin-6A synthase (deacetylating) [Sedimentitalea sp. CY04]|uniref:Precorrin-6A synthase [deacetylating] n=1 Tax=Parasedimentitalea denitrificans TaxID=2211118 RepID=A0ABX0W2D1_9RHOB|nr:precorrin-6A synthase (deacetylating) [Sedimentitalea sp. CY04]NIZ59699.1 precorrin-6A synthase (deacetylating) [Sedimentitalea sp. CY04]